MSKNSNLHKAKKEKNDEFYTLLSDIEKEMKYYKDYFKDKVVYCNCDDAKESNFFKYFSENFELLGLKKLITTGYKEGGHGVVLVYEGDKNGDFMVSDDEISTQPLAGDGDFRSPECIEFLKQADVVVTNPPFSLFREYIAQLFQYNKKFLIIGNQNAITYKEIFPYIKDGKLWLGRTMDGSNRWFMVPNSYEVREGAAGYKEENGKKYLFVNSPRWFTNIANNSKREILTLIKSYNSKDYPIYDNYNAIEVRKISNLPYDYWGIAGVPITSLKYLWSDGYLHFDISGSDSKFSIIGHEHDLDGNGTSIGQFEVSGGGCINESSLSEAVFEIIGCADADIVPAGWKGMDQSFVDLYYNQGNTGSYKQGNRLAHYIDNKGNAVVPFKRLLIKRK